MEEKAPDEMEMAAKENEEREKKKKDRCQVNMDKITEEKLQKYFKITGEAIQKVKYKEPKNVNFKAVADDFLDMAKRYYEDAKHFKDKGDMVTAFAALNYAHGFLDAGARLGVFDVKDSRLFAAD
jgi:hypothetical protein